MVRERSWMKQAEISAHSEGRSGGDSLVLDWPAVGVLQMMATAMLPLSPAVKRVGPTGGTFVGRILPAGLGVGRRAAERDRFGNIGCVSFRPRPAKSL